MRLDVRGHDVNVHHKLFDKATCTNWRTKSERRLDQDKGLEAFVSKQVRNNVLHSANANQLG